ncbi:hypothetical protein AB0J35_02215 [Nonomuraea angiospora]|uniref:hypothetical protein n=1 Tax=Nonomuraea angiospora TaxID=46172 RepID=UPI00343D4CA6
MRRRAHLLATAALLGTLASAVVLSPAGIIPKGGFPPISQRLVNSLTLTNGYVTTLNTILGSSLGDLNLHV